MAEFREKKLRPLDANSVQRACSHLPAVTGSQYPARRQPQLGMIFLSVSRSQAADISDDD
jgi:hypothetical protein